MEIEKFLDWFCLIMVVVILVSCKKEEGLSYTDKPVIQAYLVPGSSVLVKVNMQKGLLDTAAYGLPIEGLQIEINDGSKSITLLETQKGEYTFNDGTFVSTGKTYTMNFTYLDKVISAKTSTPRKPLNIAVSDTVVSIPLFSSDSSTFTPVTVSWENTDNLNHLLVFKNDSEYPSSLSSGGFNRVYQDIEASMGTATSSFEIQKTTFRYTGYYTIFVYTLNQEYIDILNNNGGSSLNLTNPVTNIANGLGIFTSMNVDTLRLFVREK